MKLIFSTFLFLVLATPVFAAPEYSISPLVIDIEAEARDILTRTITVTNTGYAPATIFPTVNNISIDDGGLIKEFLSPVETDRTQTLSSWLEFSRKGINLQAGQTVELPITLRMHPSPVPGTYHAFIGFGYGRNRPEAEKMVLSGKAPGSIITVTIEEKKNQFLKLSQFVVDRFVTSVNNNAAVYTFKNPSDETLTPKGEIIFYDNRGREVGSATVNDENLKIVPGKEHVFKTNVPVEGLFGRYKAFLNVEYGNEQKAQIQDTSFFYIFPFKSLAIILGLLITVVAGLAWFLHKKFFDEDEIHDHEPLMVHIKNGNSPPVHHDIDLKHTKNEK